LQRDLVEAARRGDHQAFEALATGVSRRLYSIARLILRDAHLAEDAVQDTLVHAWRRLPTLRDPERFNAWIHRLVVNACADVGRDRRRMAVEVRLIRPAPDVDDTPAHLADRDQLERAFLKLKSDQRAAIVLHYYLGLPASQVAEALGVPVGTAKSRIHYAVATMRSVLEAEERAATNQRRERSA
jgi:RNA polymerase sigma-70 factor (ECF subfamily)